jgi:hypothetical protein
MVLRREKLNGEDAYRITLPRNGAEVIVEENSVMRRVYVFAGKQGDALSVSLVPLAGDPFFGVMEEPDMKRSVTRVADERGEWNGQLPASADFAIRISSFPASTYQLRLRLKKQQRQWLSLYSWLCAVVVRARLVAGY